MAGPERGLHLKLGQCCHQHGLDPLDEPADAGDARFQLEHRIPDELARTVKRYVSPAFDAVQRNTPAREFGLAHEQV